MSDTPQCMSCGRFVSVATAYKDIEHGDYGAVLSVAFECQRCVDAQFDREVAAERRHLTELVT